MKILGESKKDMMHGESKERILLAIIPTNLQPLEGKTNKKEDEFIRGTIRKIFVYLGYKKKRDSRDHFYYIPNNPSLLLLYLRSNCSIC